MTSGLDLGAVVSIPDTAGHGYDSEVLSKLIFAASAMLDSDPASAKACIQRAAELLGVRRTGEERCVQTGSVIRGGLAPWQQKQIAAHVAANIGSNIQVRDLARVARLSVGHFFKAFRDSFGEPPMAYVVRQRIRRGQSLMLSSRAPLSRIAADCGMCDQAHFTRVFHRIVGITPSVWRRQFSSGELRTDVVVKRESITPRPVATVQYGSRRVGRISPPALVSNPCDE